MSTNDLRQPQANIYAWVILPAEAFTLTAATGTFSCAIFSVFEPKLFEPKLNGSLCSFRNYNVPNFLCLLWCQASGKCTCAADNSFNTSIGCAERFNPIIFSFHSLPNYLTTVEGYLSLKWIVYIFKLQIDQELWNFQCWLINPLAKKLQ